MTLDCPHCDNEIADEYLRARGWMRAEIHFELLLKARERAFEDGKGVERVRQAFTAEGGL